MRVLTKPGIFQSPNKSTMTDNSSMINVLEYEWIRFADEQDSFNISLDGTSRAMWRAKIIVKIDLAKNLDKSINSSMTSKQFPKLGGRDSFMKRNRNTSSAFYDSFMRRKTKNRRTEESSC